ncbi:MAG: prepilin-type N-terminal cleavage/methylation domain-containing protein [Idiomarina sp.]|nr:prepilin-type N-terminal cleavage/methylation domain-containing protein [Idiomarina sp.]
MTEPDLGFSLVEVLLALALAAGLMTAVVHWHLSTQSGLRAFEDRAQADYQLHRLATWVWRDAQRHFEQHGPNNWSFAAVSQCLLYGDAGVRVRSQTLQWRPQSGTCESVGWHGLSDASQVRIAGMRVDDGQWCLSATPDLEVCLPWST